MKIKVTFTTIFLWLATCFLYAFALFVSVGGALQVMAAIMMGIYIFLGIISILLVVAFHRLGKR